MRHRLRPKVPHSARRRTEDAQLLRGILGEFLLSTGEKQRPIGLQLAHEQRDLLLLPQRAVVRGDGGRGENLGENVLKGLRILAHIQRRKVEAKRRHRRAQSGKAVIGDDVIVELAQRTVDHVQVPLEFLRRRIRAWRRLPLQPRQHLLPDAEDGPAVGLVDAGFFVVVGGVGKRAQFLGTGGIPIRQGELALQLAELVGVVLQHRRCGLAGGVGQGVLVNKGVAVMVAANPGAGADDGGIGKLLAKGLTHGVANGAVEGGNLVEQRKLVVAQADVNLVFEGGAGDTNQRGLPQQSHAQVHFLLDRRHVAAAVRFLEEILDVGLGIEDGAAAGFGGVRGENGGDVSASDDGGGVGGRDAFFFELGECLAQGNRRLDGLVIQVLR